MFGFITVGTYLKDWKYQRVINSLQKQSNDLLQKQIVNLYKRLEILEETKGK